MIKTKEGDHEWNYKQLLNCLSKESMVMQGLVTANLISSSHADDSDLEMGLHYNRFYEAAMYYGDKSNRIEELDVEAPQESVNQLKAEGIYEAVRETAYENEFEEQYTENRETVIECHAEFICNQDDLINYANNLRNKSGNK